MKRAPGTGQNDQSPRDQSAINTEGRPVWFKNRGQAAGKGCVWSYGPEITRGHEAALGTRQQEGSKSLFSSHGSKKNALLKH